MSIKKVTPPNLNDLFNHSISKEMRYLCTYYTAKALIMSNDFCVKSKVRTETENENI